VALDGGAGSKLHHVYEISPRRSSKLTAIMRKGLSEVFDDTLNSLLGATLAAMLGSSVRDEVYSVLSTRGIAKKEVPTRFDEVFNFLAETFGVVGAKVIIYKVISELHQEYSQPVDFSFQGALRDKLLSLRERVVSNHIWPRHEQDANSFFDKESSDGNVKAGLAGLYRYKRGVGSNSNPDR